MPSNAHISWDGKASHPKDNKTRTVDIVWVSNPYTWGDVSLAAEISPITSSVAGLTTAITSFPVESTQSPFM